MSPTSTSRSTRHPRRRVSGTPSRPWVPGGPSYRRTERAADRRLRRAGGDRRGLLRHAPVVVRALAVARPRLHLPARDPRGFRARVARAPALANAAAAADRARGRVRRRGGPAAVGRRRNPRELREARGDDVRRVVLPALLRGAELGRARSLHRAVGRRVLGVARPDEHDHAQARARVLLALVRVPGAGLGRRCPARPAGSPLLRALPRRGRPLESPRRLDLGLPDHLARRHAGARDLAGARRLRPPRAAAPLARIPAAERRPALARGQGSRRQRSPSKSDVTQAEPAASATASGLVPTGIVRATELVAGSTTETVASSMFGTQSLPPTQALASGLAPTVTTAWTASETGSTR